MGRRRYEDDEMYDTEEREDNSKGFRHSRYTDEDDYDDEPTGFPIKKIVFGVLSIALVGGLLIGVVPIVQRIVVKDNAVSEQPIDTVSAVATPEAEKKEKDTKGTKDTSTAKEEEKEAKAEEAIEEEDEDADADMFADMEAEEVVTPTPNPEIEKQKKKEKAEKRKQKKEADKSLGSKISDTSKNGYLSVEGSGEGATDNQATYVVDDSGTVFAYFGTGVINTASAIYTSVDGATPVANLEANTKVDVIDVLTDWYQVRTMDGVTGYIPKTAVTMQ